MSDLQIRSIKNGTKPEEEYVELYAVNDVNLSHYALLDKTFSKDGSLSNMFRHFHQLPNKKILKGQYVRVYTGVGKDSIEDAKAGTTTVKLNNLYWGSKECIWNNNSKDQATLIQFVYKGGKAA